MGRTKSSNQTRLMCKLNRTVGGLNGKAIQQEIDRWIEKSGLSWTSNRLKAIRNAAYLLKEKQVTKAISLLRSESIAHTSDGMVKGHFRPIISNFVHSKRPAVVKRAATLLRSYTALRDKSVSLQVWRKGLLTITSPKPRTAEYEESILKAKLLIDTALDSLGYDRIDKYPSNRTSVSRLVIRRQDFCLSNLKPFTSCYSPVPLDPEIRERPYGYAIHSLMTTSELPRSISFIAEPARNKVREKTMLCKDLPYYSEPMSHRRKFGESEPVGKVAILNEYGCKGRIIAIPNAWIQLHMYPLHVALSTYEELVPNSWVKRQPEAAEEILSHMRKGGYVKSIDLSSATDRFPLELQTHFLEKVGQPEYAKAIEEISLSKWEYPPRPLDLQKIRKKRLKKGVKISPSERVIVVSYNKGQPMGMYGSFPLFSLTHSLLLKGIEVSLEKEGKILHRSPSGQCSYVLGDDVVITDKRVERAYMQLMRKLDVPISKHKSFGGPVTEFAGFTFMKLGKDKRTAQYIGFRPLKYTDDFKKLEQVDTMYSLGSKYTKLFSGRKRQKMEKVYKAFVSTIPDRYKDLSPYIGDDEKLSPEGKFGLHEIKSITIERLYHSRNSYVYPDYDSLKGGEPLFYDGPTDNLSSRFHSVSDEKPLRKAENKHEYSAPSYSKDPLITKALDDEHREEDLKEKLRSLLDRIFGYSHLETRLQLKDIASFNSYDPKRLALALNRACDEFAWQHPGQLDQQGFHKLEKFKQVIQMPLLDAKKYFEARDKAVSLTEQAHEAGKTVDGTDEHHAPDINGINTPDIDPLPRVN